MDIKQRRLPADYQEVEWIQSSGTQYIDTGFSIATYYNSFKSVVEGSFTNLSSGQFFGTYIPSTQYFFMLGISGSNFQAQIGQGGTEKSIVQADSNNHIFTLDCVNSSASVDNTTITGLTKYNQYGDFHTLVLFSRVSNGGGVASFCHFKMKSTKFYINNILSNEYIPCYHKTSGIIGLYDIVGGQFYTNQGTGTFTKGDDVVTLESMTIPQGDVLRINDGNGNLLWKKHLYDFKDFWDEAVGYNLTTGEDENGKYVNTPGSVIYDKTFAYKSYAPNKKFRVFIRAVNTSYTGVTNLDLRYTDGTMSSVLTASLAGTTFETDSSKTFAGVHGRWHGGSPRIYDLYIDEVS